MQCYTEIVPPSGVTHSLSSSFTGPNASNLIVARSSLLQIFSTNQAQHTQDVKLVLLADFSLSGIITALGRVKLLHSKSGGEALLIAFRDAKLSLIEWDPSQYSISTISIHYYENHDLLLCPWAPDLQDCISRLTIDPSSRCAAYNFGIGNLAIIPFHQSGDDLVMDDFDDIDDDDEKKSSVVQSTHNGSEINVNDKPYAPSFVLPLTVLDPSLVHPVDMAFLYEYRQPTIGILYSVLAPSNNMAAERKDVMIYSVYTLDIEQRASTTLSSIPKLPNDLHKVVALPLPIGGSLLIGGNEIIHIDQGGKANAIGVNEFAKEDSSFPMSDQSELRMRLEGCQIEQIGNSNGDMLMTLSSGELVILSFRRDGRSVSGLSLQRSASIHLNSEVLTRASTMSSIGYGRIFIGSEESDSLLLGPIKPNAHIKRHNSKVQENGQNSDSDLDDDDEDDDDDDLYTDTKTDGANSYGANFTNSLRVLDRLQTIGSINDIAFGRPPKRKRGDEDSFLDNDISLEMAIACGRGKAGALAFLSRGITPRIIKQVKIYNAIGLWSINTKYPKDDDDQSLHHDTLIVSTSSEDGPGRSSLMTFSHGDLRPREDTDFDGNTITVAVGRLPLSNHTIQVSANDVRVYDADFGLSQIFPIVDEDSGEIAQVVSAICTEPYVVFVKDDRTLSLLKADESGELDEIELPANIPTTNIASATLFHDSSDFFGTSKYGSKSSSPSDLVIMSILTTDGNFGCYTMADLKVQVFFYRGMNFLPPHLFPDVPLPKHWKNPDEIAEILLANIGDKSDQSPYLVIQNTTGDITLYQPYPTPDVEGSYRFIKVATKNADAVEAIEDEMTTQNNEQPMQQLKSLQNVNGYSAIFVAGRNSSMILKSSHSRPRIYSLRTGHIKHVTNAHNSACSNGFVYIDSLSNLNFSVLPPDTNFDICDQPTRKVPLHEEVTGVCYHPKTSSYVITTHTPTPFQLPQDDEWHPEWTEETTQFLPTTTTSHIKLLSSSSENIISTYTFEPSERVLSTRCLSLEISEETHEFADLIVVGTAITKGENVVTRGNIYVFSIASVNPRPGIPETDKKLKLITKEDVRGSVSAITAIGSQGYFLAAQGQKCMVRGLKEDKSVLPVAFLDMRYHTHVARNLQDTGLTILGDAFSGLWLMGYSEEPYKMQLLSRDFEDPECLAADFLPDGKQLFIISADANGDLRVLEYDPENPKTERGAKLLLRSTFSTGSYQTSITLLPRTPVSSELTNNGGADDMELDGSTQQEAYKQHNVLLTSQTGSMALITPLSTQSYRRLSTLQNILMNQLEQPCGLNPRAFRAVETDGMGGRGIIDGEVVKRWLGLSSWHKASLADKVGGTVWEVRGDVEAVCGQGLGYL